MRLMMCFLLLKSVKEMRFFVKGKKRLFLSIGKLYNFYAFCVKKKKNVSGGIRFSGFFSILTTRETIQKRRFRSISQGA